MVKKEVLLWILFCNFASIISALYSTWAWALVTLVFFYSILKNDTSEADAVASHKSQAVIKGSTYESDGH